MQSRPPLQERAVDVVINFLARQRGSCVMWPYLPACGNTVRAPTTDVNLPRCRRVRRCLISRRRLSGTTTRRSLALFPHSDGLDVHTTDLSLTVVRGGSGTLATSTASIVLGIRRCRLYNFCFTENAIFCGAQLCAGCTRMHGICTKIW